MVKFGVEQPDDALSGDGYSAPHGGRSVVLAGFVGADIPPVSRVGRVGWKADSPFTIDKTVKPTRAPK